jgi:hypothetical protein
MIDFSKFDKQFQNFLDKYLTDNDLLTLSIVIYSIENEHHFCPTILLIIFLKKSILTQVDDSQPRISPDPAGTSDFSGKFPSYPYRNTPEIGRTWKQHSRLNVSEIFR